MKKQVTGSVWIEYSETIGDKLIRRTIKADDRTLVLHQLDTYEDRGNGRNGDPSHIFEVTLPGFEAEL